jgi:hypothetical protein
MDSKCSKAMELLAFVWYEHVADSHDATKRAMQCALTLAIDARLEFAPDDFATIVQRFKGKYWLGADDAQEHLWYARAVAASNGSACRAFEVWKKRKPLIVPKLDLSFTIFEHGGRSRKNERLHVGCQLRLGGQWVTVNSIRDDYANATGADGKRIKITREDVKAMRAPKASAKEKTDGTDL